MTVLWKKPSPLPRLAISEASVACLSSSRSAFHFVSAITPIICLTFSFSLISSTVILQLCCSLTLQSSLFHLVFYLSVHPLTVCHCTYFPIFWLSLVSSATCLSPSWVTLLLTHSGLRDMATEISMQYIRSALNKLSCHMNLRQKSLKWCDKTVNLAFPSQTQTHRLVSVIWKSKTEKLCNFGQHILCFMLKAGDMSKRQEINE